MVPLTHIFRRSVCLGEVAVRDHRAAALNGSPAVPCGRPSEGGPCDFESDATDREYIAPRSIESLREGLVALESAPIDAQEIGADGANGAASLAGYVGSEIGARNDYLLFVRVSENLGTCVRIMYTNRYGKPRSKGKNKGVEEGNSKHVSL